MTPPQVHEAEAACRGVEWVEILSKTPLRPGVEATRMHYFALPAGSEGTHLRLNYFPDGGVARLRLWGNVVGDRPRPTPGPAYSPQVTGEVCTVVPHSSSTTAPPPSQRPYPHPELSLESRGGRELLCSNKHYGRPLNLIQPTLGKDMGDGWETARHPSRPSILVKDAVTNLVDSPLMDWCVIKLGSVAASGVSRIILDTKHFRGNYPESVQVQGCYLDTATEDEDQERALLSDVDSDLWFPLVKRCRMSPDSEHVFDADSNQIASANRPVSHVKVSIYPDGGLSRVRVYGAV